MARSEEHLQLSGHLRTKHIRALEDFFPEINTERLLEIEDFHSQLSTVLKKKIREVKRTVLEELSVIHEDLESIDQSISTKLQPIDNPTVIVDRVAKLSQSIKHLEGENEFYDENNSLLEAVRTAKEDLERVKTDILENIQTQINDKMRQLVTAIYNSDRKSPRLELGINSYKFKLLKDTGTGKAYSNLIVFDLSVRALTDLPFLIHDSFLYKNIENPAVASIIKMYVEEPRQTFISIDEIAKYGDKAANTLKECKAIQLDSQNLLYDKDWRSSE